MLHIYLLFLLKFQLIGATTVEEYRKYIEKDSALERRFSPIQVDEPTEAETIEILKGIRDKYEAHHNVKITDDAVKSAVTLSKRYITDRFLPDKAIDLIDEASSKIRAKRIRVELDDSNEKIGYKIRKAQLEKVPYMLVIGANEQESQVVTVRARKNGANLGEMTIDEFIEKVQNEVENKAIDR